MRREPVLSFKPELADAMAIKAVASGGGDEGQQKRAIYWVINGLCQVNTLSFTPENQRISDFLEGRRSVGLEIAMYATLPVDELKQVFVRRKDAA